MGKDVKIKMSLAGVFSNLKGKTIREILYVQQSREVVISFVEEMTPVIVVGVARPLHNKDTAALTVEIKYPKDEEYEL